jgi:hypothetical protein
MPGPMCSCQCKMCRVPGSSHCRAHPGCSVPVTRSRAFAGRDEKVVAGAMRALKTGSGSHSPSVAEFERAMPGLVTVDACFLSNPYATDVAMSRLGAIEPVAARADGLALSLPESGARVAARRAHRRSRGRGVRRQRRV